MPKNDKPALPQRPGFFLGTRRQHAGSQADGWEDKKRDPANDPQPSTEHVAKHRKDGFPTGSKNP